MVIKNNMQQKMLKRPGLSGISDRPKGNGIKMMAFVLMVPPPAFLCRSLLVGFVRVACRNIFAMPFLCGTSSTMLLAKLCY
jgi:hypothetical protein